MSKHLLDDEVFQQFVSATDGQKDADKRTALQLKADDVEAGDAEFFTELKDTHANRRKIAVALRKLAKSWE